MWYMARFLIGQQARGPSEDMLTSVAATKSDVAEAIKRLEACVAWRRSVKIDDVQAMADDCEPEVSSALFRSLMRLIHVTVQDWEEHRHGVQPAMPSDHVLLSESKPHTSK